MVTVDTGVVLMGKVEELLQRVSDGDLDAVEELKAAIEEDKAASSRDAERARYEVKLMRDPAVKEKYPRAYKAYEKGKLSLPDNLSDEAVDAAFKDKEEELADLGVPLPTAASPSAETPPADKPEPSGFGPVIGPSSPAAAAPESKVGDLTKRMDEGARSLDFVKTLHEVQREPGRSGERAMHDVIEPYMADPHPESVI